MIDEGVFRLQPVGRIGARRTDRIFMDAVRYRAGQLKKAEKPLPKKQQPPPLVELAAGVKR
jgi:hypothetical protein